MENQAEKTDNTLFQDLQGGYAKVTLGLDIGTTKIVAIIGAKETNDSPMQILGIGETVSEGLNRGVVVNINKTVEAIKSATKAAEEQAGIKVKDVVCGIAGDHIRSFSNHGIVTISNKNHEIKRDDISRVLLDARKMAISKDKKILHVLPQTYFIDAQDGVTTPLGMKGTRLEVTCQIITGLDTAIQNIVQSVNLAGYNVSNIVLEPLASSRATLCSDEREVGVALIDIGGGTTDVAIFHDHVIKYTSVIGVAGKQVSDDIRNVLGIVSREAERVKRNYGCAYEKIIKEDSLFQVPGIGGSTPKDIKRSELATIIQDRMQEIFELAGREILNSGLVKALGAGIVITGGTTLLEGSEILASDIFGIPARIGNPSPQDYTGLTKTIATPIYSTAIGLTLYGLYDDMYPEQKVDLNNQFIENDVSDRDETVQDKKAKKKKEKDANKPSLKDRISGVIDNL